MPEPGWDAEEPTQPWTLTAPREESPRPGILIIEGDTALADLLYAVFTDAAGQVTILGDSRPDAIRVAVGQLEPDCILFDSAGSQGYGTFWETANWRHRRGRPVPTIMLTADAAALNEAQQGTSARSQAAGLVAVIAKPFEPDELLRAVEHACGLSEPFDRSLSAEAGRTAVLVDLLRDGGAQDICASTRREWVTFRTADGTLVQLYWWHRDGLYYVLRYATTGGFVERVGQFHDLGVAIALALTVRGEPSADGSPGVRTRRRRRNGR